jgi:hypothetical protein
MLWKWADGPLSCSCNECDQKTLFELQMEYQSFYYMQQFWQDILIGDGLLGAVGTAGAAGAFGGAAAGAGAGAGAEAGSGGGGLAPAFAH